MERIQMEPLGVWCKDDEDVDYEEDVYGAVWDLGDQWFLEVFFDKNLNNPEPQIANVKDYGFETLEQYLADGPAAEMKKVQLSLLMKHGSWAQLLERGLEQCAEKSEEMLKWHRETVDKLEGQLAIVEKYSKTLADAK